MFSTLKILKEKYQNSSTWTELFLSLTSLENVYERLDQAKTDKERVGILTEALELQQNKLKELIEEIAKQKEQIEELENKIKVLENKNDDGLIKLLVKANEEADKLGINIKQTQALIEVKKIVK